MVVREPLLSSVAPLVQVTYGIGSPNPTQVSTVVLPASTVEFLGDITTRGVAAAKRLIKLIFEDPCMHACVNSIT